MRRRFIRRKIMAEFQDEIRNIAKEKEQKRQDKIIVYMADEEKIYEIKEAMGSLFSLAELGVKAYNEGLGVKDQVLSKAKQLIKISCLRSKDGFIFLDNTGANLNPEDVIKHIIIWISG